MALDKVFTRRLKNSIKEIKQNLLKYLRCIIYTYTYKKDKKKNLNYWYLWSNTSDNKKMESKRKKIFFLDI